MIIIVLGNDEITPRRFKALTVSNSMFTYQAADMSVKHAAEAGVTESDGVRIRDNVDHSIFHYELTEH